MNIHCARDGSFWRIAVDCAVNSHVRFGLGADVCREKSNDRFGGRPAIRRACEGNDRFIPTRSFATCHGPLTDRGRLRRAPRRAQYRTRLAGSRHSRICEYFFSWQRSALAPRRRSSPSAGCCVRLESSARSIRERPASENTVWEHARRLRPEFRTVEGRAAGRPARSACTTR